MRSVRDHGYSPMASGDYSGSVINIYKCINDSDE